MKKWGWLIAVVSIVFLMTACNSESSNEKEESSEGQYKVGMTQLVEHPSLNAASEGFKKAFEDAGVDVAFVEQNAQNDHSLNATIANNFVSDQVDLIFANSTPSAQAVANETTEIPIVFTSVTDAEAAQLVESHEAPGRNVTGTLDNHPEAIEKAVTYVVEELDAKKIGMIFNSGEQNSRAQVDEAKKQAEALGAEVVEASVSASSEVQQAAESLVGKVDAFYIITDNTVVSAMESVISVANDHQLPLMAGEVDSVERGALAAYGFDFYDIGYQAGEMAVDILVNGKDPATMPVEAPKKLELVVNEETKALLEE